jgi:hypothetical protein
VIKCLQSARAYPQRRTFKSKRITARWAKRVDMRAVLDEILFAESVRRMRARQKHPPRAEVLRSCPKCGALFGARKLRAHNPNPNRIIRKITNPEDQDAENYRYWQRLPIGERLAAICELTEAAYSVRKVQ